MCKEPITIGLLVLANSSEIGFKQLVICLDEPADRNGMGIGHDKLDCQTTPLWQNLEVKPEGRWKKI